LSFLAEITLIICLNR